MSDLEVLARSIAASLRRRWGSGSKRMTGEAAAIEEKRKAPTTGACKRRILIGFVLGLVRASLSTPSLRGRLGGHGRDLCHQPSGRCFCDCCSCW